MQQYFPPLVAPHWIMGPVILGALAVGGLFLASLRPDNSNRAPGPGCHTVFGVAIGILLGLRLRTRLGSVHPPHARAGNARLDRFGSWAHWGIYLSFAVMVLVALGLGLLAAVYSGAADVLIAEPVTSAPHVAPGFIALILGALIAHNFADVIHHQFIRQDGLRGRMWFGGSVR